MSLVVPGFPESVIVRSADAEVVGRAPSTVRLLADASSTLKVQALYDMYFQSSAPWDQARA